MTFCGWRPHNSLRTFGVLFYSALSSPHHLPKPKMQHKSEIRQCVSHCSHFRRLESYPLSKVWFKIILNIDGSAWKQKHTNKSAFQLSATQVNPNNVHAEEWKGRPVVTHMRNNLEGLFLNQPPKFHEQWVSSFGKPLLHHALVKNKPAAYASSDWHIEKGLPYLTEQLLAFPETSKVKNSLAILKAMQNPNLSSTAGVRPVAAEFLAFSLPTQGLPTSCQLISGAQERCLQDQETAQAWLRGLLEFCLPTLAWLYDKVSSERA